MDPMLYISLASGLVFAFIGNWMARRRGAHTVLWTLVGFIFPPALLILKLIHWKAEPRPEDYEDDEGDDDEGGEGGQCGGDRGRPRRLVRG